MQRNHSPRWSWQLGSMFGIEIRVHITLLALFAWIVIAPPLRGSGLVPGLIELAMVACLFAIIVVHELAHALVARRYGSTTKDILLLPIGGIANIDRIPDTPDQELRVALAGPAVNLAVAGALAILLAATGSSFKPMEMASLAGFAATLMWLNLSLAGFNLLPAFPMDGGRVLRAVLARSQGRARATQLASRVGRIMAVLFIAIGIFYNAFLAIIGVLVWYLARQEETGVTVRTVLRGATVRDAMIRALDPVDAESDPFEVATRMIADGVRVLPVIDGSRIAGVITVDRLVQRLRGADPHDLVRGVTRDVPQVSPDTPLADTVDLFDRVDHVLVVEDGALVGMLTLEQIATYGELSNEPIGPLLLSGSEMHGARP
jgi:stage IV sporulation protein FB